MGLFTPTRQPVGYSLDRATAENGIPKERLPRLGKIPSQKWELIPLAVKLGTKKSVVLETVGFGPQPFHGRIVILVNEHTPAAAEMVTLSAKENSLATIVGTKTSGRLISRTGTKVGAGYQLVFTVAAYQSWNGTRIEGRRIYQSAAFARSSPVCFRLIDKKPFIGATISFCASATLLGLPRSPRSTNPSASISRPH
jgi:carboxyl-terminal processing protease